MGDRPITPLGAQMIAELPPFLQESYDYVGVLHPLSRELELLESTIELMRAQFNPATATILLPAWETMMLLPVGGAGASTDQRQARVLQRMKKLLGDSSGRGWEQQITDMFGAGWSYLDHDPDDPSSPAPRTVLVTLPFAPSGNRYEDARRQIEEITPADMVVNLQSAAGFIVDESELDVETFGGS